MSAKNMVMLGVLAAAATLSLVAGPARAQTNTGTTFGSFLEIEPTARVAGMGNAGVSSYDGVQSIYYNPSSASHINGNEVMFSHIAWIADITYDYAAAAIPMGGWGVGYATLTSLNSGDMPVRTVNQPLGTGEQFSVSDLAFALGFARQISPRFSAGGQINFVQETIWHSSASVTSITLGTLYRVSEKGLRIGSSLSNFGTRAAFNGRDLRFVYDASPLTNGDNSSLPATQYTDAFSVPVMFRVGLAMPYELKDDQKFLFEVDAFHPNDNSESVSLGGEYTINDSVSLRGGWQNLFLKDTEVGGTAGAGIMGRVSTWRYRCDYAWADQGRLGHTHRLTLGLSF